MSKVLNSKTGKFINIYVGGTKKINPTLKKLLKKEPNAVKNIPDKFFINTAKGTIGLKRNKKGFTKAYKQQLKDNPNAIKTKEDSNKIINLETGKEIDKSKIYTKKGKLKKKWEGYKVVKGKLQKEDKFDFKDKFGEIKKHNDLSTWRIYESNNKPSNWKDLLQSVKYRMNKDFTAKQSGGRKKLLFKFGQLFRWVNWDDIKNLDQAQAEELFNNWQENFGSDITTTTGNKLIDFDKLDTGYFLISMMDTLKGGANTTKCSSKYWTTNQPPTKDNLCLEGAINRGLKLNRTAKSLRNDIEAHTEGDIKYGDKIPLTKLNIYEEFFDIKIKVYNDTTHFKEGEDEPNLILDCNYNPSHSVDTIKLLYKDEHFFLITNKKLQIKKMKNKERNHFGLNLKKKKGKDPTKAKKDAPTELLCIFDIETIFDKNDTQYLKSYGVSWFIWNKKDDFKYDPNIHNKEPYCYYEKGQDCLEKFIHFIIKPPKGYYYKPIGFNNSRFDNFALCEVANRMGLLNNVFFADGSILYAQIEGCGNCWDASRFLTGKSLHSACKDYNTNPKKRPDLIDHYEIQCYYEENGWLGLNKLLEEKEELVLYNKIDCICLLDLILKMRKSYIELFATDILENLTLSSMGYKILKRTWKENNLKIVSPYTYKADKFFRDSLTAGRTQSFYGKYDYKMPVAMGDIKSLYPTVLGNYGDNHCPFPYGRYKYTKKEMVGCLGIYNVNIKHQRCKWKKPSVIHQQFKRIREKYNIDLQRQYAPNVIARREKDKPLDWFYKDEMWNVKLTSVDIDVIRWATEDPNCIEILEGYYWDESRTDLFIHYLDPARKEKTKQDHLKDKRKKLKKENPEATEEEIINKMISNYGEDYNEAKREGCKGISNSMSGKLLEALHTDINEKFSSKKFIAMEKDEGVNEIDIVDFGNGFSMITGKKDIEKVFDDMKEVKPSYLGMFCYSYARKLMYQKILSRYITLYMDTDSACMPLMEWDRLNNENLTTEFVDTGEYGCIEEEVCDYSLCPKCSLIKKNPIEWKKYTTTKKCKDGKRCIDCSFIPADRVIAIAPKNYMVENTQKDFYSKRKFKGVRKNDFWLPMDYFGEILKDEEGKLIEEEGTAIHKIHNLTQDEIRRIREFKCCRSCINYRLEDKSYECKECDKYKSLLKKTYSTEMFEYLAQGNKIAIFCSMINRIKYKVGAVVDWEYKDITNGTPNLKDLETIINGFIPDDNTHKNPIQIKFNVDIEDKEKYFRKLKKFYSKVKTIKDKKTQNKLIKDYFDTHRKFENEYGTNEINETFKLKQQYMVKII